MDIRSPRAISRISEGCFFLEERTKIEIKTKIVFEIMVEDRVRGLIQSLVCLIESTDNLFDEPQGIDVSKPLKEWK